MSWEFEHWHDGKVYLHEDRWEAFKKDIEKNGYQGRSHDWLHTRIFCMLHTPRKSIYDIPCPGDEDLKFKIESSEEWKMVYEPFPAFQRTQEDPEGWLPSWHLWAENIGNGEQITILTTGGIYKQPNDGLIYITFNRVLNHFAVFRDMIWKIDKFENYGLGPNPPAPVVKPKRKSVSRSIFEPFEESW